MALVTISRITNDESGGKKKEEKGIERKKREKKRAKRKSDQKGARYSFDLSGILFSVELISNSSFTHSSIDYLLFWMG